MGRKSGRQGKYLYFCVACLVLLSSLGCATLRETEREQTARGELREAAARLAEQDFKGASEMNMRVLGMYPDRPPGDQAAFNMGIIFAHHANPEGDYRKSREFFAEVIRDFPPGALTGEAKVWAAVLYMCEECKGRLAETSQKVDEVTGQLKEKEQEIEEVHARLEELEGTIEEAKARREERMAIESQMSKTRKLISQKNFEGALDEQQKLASRYPNKPPGDEALFTMGLIFINADNAKKDYRRALDLFKRLVSQFPQSPRFEEAKAWVGVLDVIEKTKQVDIEIEQKKKEMTR